MIDYFLQEGSLQTIESPITAQSSPKVIMPSVSKRSSEGFPVLEKRCLNSLELRRKPLKNRSTSESTAMPPSRTSSADPAACHPQPADEQNLWAGVQLKNGNLPRSFRSDYSGTARRHPNQSEKESHLAKIWRADTESQKDLPAVFSRIGCCEQKRVATPQGRYLHLLANEQPHL